MLGRNGFVARYGWEGVAATPESRLSRDVRGQSLAVRFEIVDERPRALLPGGADANHTRGPYQVLVVLEVWPQLYNAHCSI